MEIIVITGIVVPLICAVLPLIINRKKRIKRNTNKNGNVSTVPSRAEALMPQVISTASTESKKISNFSSHNSNFAGITVRQPIPGDWRKIYQTDSTYNRKFKEFLDLTDNGKITDLTNDERFEKAYNIYWEIIYFTGYRETWIERKKMSDRLLELSNQLPNKHSEAGLILAKGYAYMYITQKKYDDAILILKQARKHFSKTGAPHDMAVYYDYMGDIYDEKGQPDKAISCYKKAEEKYIDERDMKKVKYKSSLLKIKKRDINDTAAISELYALRNDFNSICTHREELVTMEIARRLCETEALDEALDEAIRAYIFFNMINMPRFIGKAVELRQIINFKKLGVK